MSFNSSSDQLQSPGSGCVIDNDVDIDADQRSPDRSTSNRQPSFTFSRVEHAASRDANADYLIEVQGLIDHTGPSAHNAHRLSAQDIARRREGRSARVVTVASAMPPRVPHAIPPHWVPSTVRGMNALHAALFEVPSGHRGPQRPAHVAAPHQQALALDAEAAFASPSVGSAGLSAFSMPTFALVSSSAERSSAPRHAATRDRHASTTKGYEGEEHEHRSSSSGSGSSSGGSILLMGCDAQGTIDPLATS
jgi:hypothetical protein